MRTRNNSGFTLLEICIAIAIFAIGILTSLSVLVPAVRWGAEAKNDFTAAEAALSAAEFLQAGGKLNNFIYPPEAKDDGGFYPFAVYADFTPDPSGLLPAKEPTDVTLKVYRRLLDPESDDGSFQSVTSITATKLVSSGGSPQVLFETHLKLYRP